MGSAVKIINIFFGVTLTNTSRRNIRQDIMFALLFKLNNPAEIFPE